MKLLSSNKILTYLYNYGQDSRMKNPRCGAPARAGTHARSGRAGDDASPPSSIPMAFCSSTLVLWQGTHMLSVHQAKTFISISAPFPRAPAFMVASHQTLQAEQEVWEELKACHDSMLQGQNFSDLLLLCYFKTPPPQGQNTRGKQELTCLHA